MCKSTIQNFFKDHLFEPKGSKRNYRGKCRQTIHQFVFAYVCMSRCSRVRLVIKVPPNLGREIVELSHFRVLDLLYRSHTAHSSIHTSIHLTNLPHLIHLIHLIHLTHLTHLGNLAYRTHLAHLVHLPNLACLAHLT